MRTITLEKLIRHSLELNLGGACTNQVQHASCCSSESQDKVQEYFPVFLPKTDKK